MYLKPLKEEDYRQLFEVSKKSEPFAKYLIYDQYAEVMRKQEGFTVRNTEGDIVGSVTFSDFIPTVDMVLHTTILPKYHGWWLTRKMLKQIFSFPFVYLDLPRLSSYSIGGLTDVGGYTLERVGFTCEGVRRNLAKLNGSYHDLVLYGMMREDCRWL